MANITQALGAEIVLPSTTGTATSFSEARMVRLVSIGASVTVQVVSAQSGSAIGSFTMAANTTEYLQKDYTQCVFATPSGTVRGTKVGFTN